MTNNIKNITRMTTKKYPKTTNGWFVRICWKRKFYRKHFSDNRYGGTNSALLSAIVWRDRIKKEIEMPNISMHCVGVATSNTGIIGVYNEKTKISVSWRDANGRPGHSSFSIKKHGREKAMQLAIAKREEMEDWRIHGNIFPEHKKRQCKKDLTVYTREEMIEKLKEMSRWLKRRPQARDFKTINPKYGRFESMFGSWNKALEAAGLLEASR
ncbi:AP2 domain-containing protein [Candidatus Pacearchaeota archaeon]|nr:AP2 domain-containing protein [Candidatus Pacearchaeota archaeon]